MIPSLDSGRIEIPYQKTKTKIFLNKNLIFFLFNQSMAHKVKDIKNPPIQVPEIKSSIPKYRQSPTPAPTAIVQTGQKALVWSKIKKEKSKINNAKRNFFLILTLNFLLKEINNINVADKTL